MGVLDDLPVLTQRTARCAPQKGESRLARKMATDRDEKAEERRWKKEVWTRDGGKCRWCHRRCTKTLTLTNERGECHHISGRTIRAIRWRRENGALFCAACHERLTGKVAEKHVIVSTHTFTVEGVSYINGDKPVRFRRVA